MLFLALGFIVFCVGGTVFMKGENSHAPGEARGAIPLRIHAANSVGLALIAVGAILMIGAGLF
jgi:hypothetical protein